MKVCRKCGVEKSESEYHKKHNGTNGLNSRCKSCKNAYVLSLADKYASDRNVRNEAVKNCPKCGTSKSRNEFTENKRAKDGLFSECKKCAAQTKRIWSKNNPHLIKAAGFRNRIKNKEVLRQRHKNWRIKNREQIISKNKKRWLDFPHVFRELRLIKVYGLTLSDYEKMLSDQGGVCAICGLLESSKLRGKLKHMAVDHCHNTGNVRGILCTSCNTGLGKFKDNTSLLQKAINYLSSHTIVKITS